ncbi:Phosphatidylserine decarboxylase proenzyme [Zhongshania aliphaticivorans]|uniref:Phosphatidylserine decarboxylase proenzyme n=1 Tax=Zhongshania aliphaticivorans TaxID=1470434 RepID=A0A5S9MZ76_9GAMM|nr:archaetidylserine decarboxylase [Zhongshania aliphaticivorans]CAA0081809.1 Phosphatidylserine decarboxylase proenzyme [Zhongshania aliphaticivorans]CAA0084740.1 Phosphatidylserine decarboxylase proenzyme [Zhongshania aliphaticivorans]
MKIAFIILQFLLPQHALSRLVGKLAETDIPWLKDVLISRFIKQYNVDMDEAADSDPRNYRNFNAFFTRALKEGARPICEESNAIACPADGAISQIGNITDGRIFQAKGQDYSLLSLLGGDREAAALFNEGSFATIYLSPRDYHRVHMPLAGTLRTMSYIPGALFSVNTATAENVQGLFARNERAVCLFDTEAGPMAVILVGAMIVAGIETVWDGQIAPPPKGIKTTDYRQEPRDIQLEKGAEMGRFKLGSTAIVLFAKDRSEWLSTFEATTPTRLGDTLGHIQTIADSPPI